MTVLQYNTIPAEHQPLVAEAPKKKYGGRVVAAAVAAALMLATAVAGSTPVFRAASNLASCMALDCGKTTQLKLDTSNAGQWAPKQPMCISVEDRGKIVPQADLIDYPLTHEKVSAFLSKCYAPSDLKAEHLPPIYKGNYRNALEDECLNPTYKLRLEKCIDGKSRQLFTVHTSMGRIEHELPDGQIKCFTVDRDTSSVFLSTSGCWGGCAGGGPCDRFELHFNNMKPQITFMFMGGIYSKPTGHKDPCMGALARTDAKGASLKAGKQYSAGSIRVVSCAKDVLPQYQLTEWLQI